MRAERRFGRKSRRKSSGLSIIFTAYNPLYSLAGLLVGMLVGLTGVGGGSLMTPLLVLLFGFHPATAVGTDLLYASVTKSVGTAVHGKRKSVDWQIVGRLATGSVPAATVTLFILARSGSLGSHAVGILNLLLGSAHGPDRVEDTAIAGAKQKKRAGAEHEALRGRAAVAPKLGHNPPRNAV